MTLKTLETAQKELDAFKTRENLKNAYITIKMQKTSRKPFCASSQTYYCGYYATPEEAYTAILEKRKEQKVGNVENRKKPRHSELKEDLIRVQAGKSIERGHYEKAMEYAKRLNDKTLIAFINRLILTKKAA